MRALNPTHFCLAGHDIAWRPIGIYTCIDVNLIELQRRLFGGGAMPHGLKRQQPMPSVVCGCCRQLCGFRHTLHQQPTPLHGNMSAEQQPAERTRSAQLWAEEEEREINSEWASQPSAAPAKQSPVRRHLKHDREPSAAVHPPCFGHGTNQQSAAASPRCLHLPAGLTQRCHRRTRPHRAGGMAGPAGSTAPVINTGAASAAVASAERGRRREELQRNM